MKSIAVVGMMFLSMGLFAQQSSREESPQKVKEKVCVKKCDKMVKAPIQRAEDRNSNIRNANPVNLRRPVARVAFPQEEKMTTPLKKDAKPKPIK